MCECAICFLPTTGGIAYFNPMEHKAKKLVIITEKLIADKIAALIEECGATGYTVVDAGGKGSRGVRTVDRGVAQDAYANVKFEVITKDTELADDIANKIADKYFNNYSGIMYEEDVEILRPQKFEKS